MTAPVVNFERGSRRADASQIRMRGASISIDHGRIERVVAQMLDRGFAAPRNRDNGTALVANISARHMHVTTRHLQILFGSDAELTPMRWLYQNGQFASEQAVDLIGPKRRLLQRVRILGPVRKATQIELAFSDAINLGIDAPVRMSGNIAGTPGCLVLGPAGHIELPEGIIRAQRHVHMSPDDAVRYGVSQGDSMDLVVTHPTCASRLCDVKVRIDPAFKLEVHIDTDEGNACDLNNAVSVRLEKQRGDESH